MVYSVNHWFTVFVRVFFVNHWFITWFFPFELLKLRVFFPHAHPDPSGTILRSMWPGHVQLELFLHQLRSQGGWEDDDGRTRTRNWRVYDSNFFFTPKCIHSQDFHPILLNEKIQLSCQVSHAATLVQVRLTAASMGPKGALSATGKDRCLHHAAVCFLMVSGALWLGHTLRCCAPAPALLRLYFLAKTYGGCGIYVPGLSCYSPGFALQARWALRHPCLGSQWMEDWKQIAMVFHSLLER